MDRIDIELAKIRDRLNALESRRVQPGPPEHRDLVALDRHFDGRCDFLSKRVDALESERARNITALVEDGVKLKRQVAELSRGVAAIEAHRDLEARVTAIEERIVHPERSCGDLGGRVQDLEERLTNPIQAGIQAVEHWIHRAESAEAELERLGHGVEVIFVFGDDGEPKFTSRVGDASWDTRANRHRTFNWIEKTLARARVAPGGP
jgi:hypothetical protein